VKTTDHHELLRAYAQDHSESAFQELVQRYVELVYSAAIRRVSGDRELAEDVAQEVFTDLARKAAALPPTVMLGGWLHRHTGYVAATAMRAEQRRRDHERQAVEMNALNEPSDADWSQFAPVLDEAMDEMDPADRDALVLRYFERCELREVGAALGVSDDTAQKRVSRALEKLRQQLARRGITSPAAGLSTVIMANAVQAAPAGLAVSIAGSALASAAAGSVASLGILKGTTLAKLTLGIAGAVLVGVVSALLFREHQTQSRLRGENQALQDQIRQLDRLALENGLLSNQLVEAKGAREKFPEEQFRELLRLRGEVGVLRRQNAEPKETQTAPPEPIFEGNPLTAWLEEFYRMTSPRNYESSRAGPGARAVLALGTNAVPYLVHMLTTKQPRLADQPSPSARNEAEFRTGHATAPYNLIRAATACELLGPKAAAAIPALIPLLEDQNGILRAQVVAALCFIQEDADIVVPLLAERLDDTDVRTREGAIIGLSMFGAKARSALPALRKVAESQEREFSALAVDSIRKIENAPEK
jgi:RNA polymerase sigma factor (sigma-70 family)